MFRDSAADWGSTPGLGPFAAGHSPSPTLFPVTLFSYTVNKAKNGQKKKNKKFTSGKHWSSSTLTVPSINDLRTDSTSPHPAVVQLSVGLEQSAHQVQQLDPGCCIVCCVGWFSI